MLTAPLRLNPLPDLLVDIQPMICRTSLIKKLYIYFFIPAIALAFPAKTSFANDSLKVAVLPFWVHSQEDLEYMVRAIPDMLSTRLEKKGEIILVVDHSKFDQFGTAVLAPLTSADRIVTDTGVPPELASKLRDLGSEVILA